MSDTAATLIAAIESRRKPEGFDPHSRNPVDVRRAAIDYAACYRDAAAILDHVHVFLMAMQDAQPEPSTVLRNCWNCVFCAFDGTCTEASFEFSPNTGVVARWIDSQQIDEAAMPARDADGCPGFEPKENA